MFIAPWRNASRYDARPSASPPICRHTAKINGSNFTPGGIVEGECVAICKLLDTAGIDFVYAQTYDAFNRIKAVNVNTGEEETIGSWNERFAYTDSDLEAYLAFAEEEGYEHVILAGHSLGANKVIYYLSRHHDPRVERFFLLSPANLTYMMSGVTDAQKQAIKEQVESGDGDKMLPFPFMGWVECIANTAYDWQFSGLLNNVHTAHDGDFSQAAQVTHIGAMLVGTYDNFTDGDPVDFLKNLNAHMPTADATSLIFIEKTGHTYQMKHQEVADLIFEQITTWKDK
ncbi:MAG: alpha/beta fold hydrolase [Eggerthellaceae bacterium]|nr:alpha/beta fold hydrolase [Eggerthellaceae bacterium]